MTDNAQDKPVQNAQDLENIAISANIGTSEEVDVSNEDVGSKSLDELLRSPDSINKLVSNSENIDAADEEEHDSGDEEGGEETPQPKPPAKIPYQRFAEKNNEARQKEEQNRLLEEQLKERDEEIKRLLEERAYFAGKADAIAETGKTSPQQEVDELEQVDGKLRDLKAALDKKLEEIDQKYDDGDLTAKEWRKAERTYRDNAEKIKTSLETRKRSIIEERNRPSEDEIRQSLENDSRLQMETETMKVANPWMNNVPQEIWDELAEDAALALTHKGVKLTQSTESIILIRKEMVSKAKRLKYDVIFSEGEVDVSSQTPVIDNNLKTKIKLSQQQPPFPTIAGQKLPVDRTMAMRQQILKNPNSSKLDDLKDLTNEELIAVFDAAGQVG